MAQDPKSQILKSLQISLKMAEIVEEDEGG